MIRRVAYGKAILAGVIGGLAWEAVARIFMLLGVPLFDLIRTLGTMVFPSSPAFVWWPTGIALHVVIGSIWAVFYAYFFWSEFSWPPILQGVAFSVIPAAVAGFVMIPQMGWMHPDVLSGRVPHPGVFANHMGWGGPIGVLIGHIVYGVVLGSLYVRPVGYPVGRPPKELLRAQ